MIERLTISYTTFTARLIDGGGFGWAHNAGTSLVDLGVFLRLGPTLFGLEIRHSGSDL